MLDTAQPPDLTHESRACRCRSCSAKSLRRVRRASWSPHWPCVELLSLAFQQVCCCLVGAAERPWTAGRNRHAFADLMTMCVLRSVGTRMMPHFPLKRQLHASNLLSGRQLGSNNSRVTPNTGTPRGPGKSGSDLRVEPLMRCRTSRIVQQATPSSQADSMLAATGP
jgi:hypothetical protein